MTLFKATKSTSPHSELIWELTMKLNELAKLAGLNPKWKATTQGGEYESPCPSCGGKDRFYIQPNKKLKNCEGYYCCRKCGISGDSIQFCRDFLNMEFKEAMTQANARISTRPLVSSILNHKKPSFVPAKPKQPSDKWMLKAKTIVDAAHSSLLQQPRILEQLEQRGLPLDAVQTYRLGWISETTNVDAIDLDLEKKDKVWIPKGILIPVFINNNVVSLKIRRSDWIEHDKYPKYVVISGGKDGRNIIGETNDRNIMIVVESELDALALHFVLHDIGFAVAIGGSTKKPDNITDYLAKNKKHLFICHDNDEAGKKMLKVWKELYPHAIAYPTSIGKDIGEAIQQGFDIRSWILTAIENKNPASQTEIVTTIQKWSAEDQVLIDWVHKYVIERTVTRCAYDSFLTEMYLGPNSPRAVTRELQNGLKLMKQLVEALEKE